MTSNLSIFNLAKQGDVNAIASLILQRLRSQKIVAQFTFNGGELNFYVGSKIGSAKTVGEDICKYLGTSQFDVKSIKFINIYTARDGRWEQGYRTEFNNKVIAFPNPSPKNKPRPKTPPGGEHLEMRESMPLRRYLERLNIKVLSDREFSPADALMNEMAVKLGKNYPHLARLHQAIVKSISNNHTFKLNLTNSSQLEISNSTQLCQKLYNLSFLSEYYYNKKNHRISGKVDRKPEIINFFNGIWFERFIYAEIHELFVRNNIDYECLINPHLEFSNGDKFELDFLFLVNGQILWIECKSGNNHCSSYATYENHKKSMQLPKNRSLIVLLKASDKMTEELTLIRDLTIANTDNLIEKVKRGLNWEIDA